MKKKKITLLLIGILAIGILYGSRYSSINKSISSTYKKGSDAISFLLGQDGQIFYSGGRDSTIVYPLSESEYPILKNTLNFTSVEKTTDQESEINLTLMTLKNAIQNNYDRYEPQEQKEAQEIQKNIHYRLTLPNTQYAISHPRKGHRDHEIYIYNTEKQKGYRIIQHM